MRSPLPSSVPTSSRSIATLEKEAVRAGGGTNHRLGLFDAVLVFNYLDRPRFPRTREAVRKGGLLIVESFLTTQREQGWGPTADAHLLLPGELARLVAPFEIMHGREVAEPVDTERWRHVASVCARNTG